MMKEQEALKNALDFFLNEHLIQIILSNPCSQEGPTKSKIRPLLLKGELVFQAQEQVGKQAFHQNLSRSQAEAYLESCLQKDFRQAQIESELGTAAILVSKKGKMTVKVKKRPVESGQNDGKIRPLSGRLAHNRKKRYILEEGTAVPFLVDLGVMSKDGTIIHSRYDKYRQINRFLEFIEDILPELDQSRENTIIDFGCGKSYLTFAMYYYLKELKGYPVRIIGLDLKQDVIDQCNRLSESYGYENLRFYHGDIASYEGADHADMVVTLHACDMATDYAMEKAVNWGARVILSVPCCQHELNGQLENQLLKPVLQYGLIKERMSALYTDAIRAQVLEYRGYRTQILEFIDMEHTPKNILVRAIFRGTGKDNGKELRELLAFLNAEPAIVRLLAPEFLS